MFVHVGVEITELTEGETETGHTPSNQKAVPPSLKAFHKVPSSAPFNVCITFLSNIFVTYYPAHVERFQRSIFIHLDIKLLSHG